MPCEKGLCLSGWDSVAKAFYWCVDFAMARDFYLDEMQSRGCELTFVGCHWDLQDFKDFIADFYLLINPYASPEWYLTYASLIAHIFIILGAIFSSLPKTTRGSPTVLKGDPKGKNFLYTNGTSVFIRDIEVIKFVHLRCVVPFSHYKGRNCGIFYWILRSLK